MNDVFFFFYCSVNMNNLLSAVIVASIVISTFHSAHTMFFFS